MFYICILKIGFEFSKRGMSTLRNRNVDATQDRPPRRVSNSCVTISTNLSESFRTYGVSTDAVFYVSIVHLSYINASNSGYGSRPDTRPCGRVNHLDLKGTFGRVEDLNFFQQKSVIPR